MSVPAVYPTADGDKRGVHDGPFHPAERRVTEPEGGVVTAPGHPQQQTPEEAAMPEQKSFWQTAPGTVAAVAAMVTALAGAIPVINAIRGGNGTPSASTTPSPSASSSTEGGATTREWDPLSRDDAAVPAVIASPATLDLGKVAPGLAAGTKVVQFVNTGSEAVVLGELRVIGPGAAAYTAGGTCAEVEELAPEANCDVEVRFAPTDAGVHEATLVLDRSPGEPLTVPLKGVASLL